MNVRPDHDATFAERRSVKFNRLLLNGFKSFPDRAEILIEPGLTGVVGPNGCGKSNLLEGLKWAMGETSPRRMRGENMDDVIFGGTVSRPARNVAEVVIELDNAGRTAPVGLNDADVLEVSRKIERGQGTSYRVNGQGVRQRDVQTLFQDNAAGALSPAIVSQGRVSSLINAKPSDRRAVLEEAAGVSGLQSRRQEAANKIKTTEANIQRADDLLSQSGDILGSLRRQARQVQRRREIDALVKAAEAMVLGLRYQGAKASEEKARAEHAANEARVEAAMLAVAEAERERERVAATLLPAREARAKAEADLVRAQARLEGAANEAARIRKDFDEARRRIVEAAADRQRVDQEIAEATRQVQAAQAERIELAKERAGEGEALEAASDAVEAAREALAEADRKHAEAAAILASSQASRDAAARARLEASSRVEAIENRLNQASQKLDAARARVQAVAGVEEAEERVRAAEEGISFANEALEAAEAAGAAARDEESRSSAGASSLQKELSRVSGEREGLRAVRVDAPSADPISGHLKVVPGYEAAVAAAFGDSAFAGRDGGEGAWWERPVEVPELWANSTLAEFVSGVPEVEAFLASVAVCDDADLPTLRGQGLPPGCMAVTRSGAFLRWDGFQGRIGSGKVQAAFERANRLATLDAEIEALSSQLQAAEAASVAAKTEVERTRLAETAARAGARAASEEVGKAREALAGLRRAMEEVNRVLAVAESEVSGIRAERQEALAILGKASQALAEIPDDAAARAEQARAKAGVDAAREAESVARVHQGKLNAEANARRQRHDVCLREEAGWTKRLNEANVLRDGLGQRAEEAQAVLERAEEAMQAAPDGALEAAQEAVVAATETVVQSRAREAAADKEKEAVDGASRNREVALGTLREERARLLGNIQVAQNNREAAVNDIQAQLNCDPDAVEALTGHPADQPKPDLSSATSKLTRLERERESLGAVNFLAEQELKEQEERFGAIEKGRVELKETIKKLFEAKEQIEEEARLKLTHAFRVIDAHFGDLFRELFSGGEAHLRLAGSEDILEAGLEIYASPPGKRMQILSLLSGGEQALTAMALIFAAFLSNPAPICVLDEVDAPLDDANADRLCRLMETMARKDATRFLVITHNPLTMARMNRLYGVTMAERGVSSVSKVDLDKAIAIIDT